MSSIHKIRQVEKELSECEEAARAGGSFRNDYRKRAYRLRRLLMNLKFDGVRPERHVWLSKEEMKAASQVDALAGRFREEAKALKREKVSNWRATAFDAARREANRRQERKNVIRQKGIFSIGEVWK